MKLFVQSMALSALVCLITGCTTLSDWYAGVYDTLRLHNQHASVEQRDPPGIDEPMTYRQYESELKQLDRKQATN
jgi:hypothetical protein